MNHTSMCFTRTKKRDMYTTCRAVSSSDIITMAKRLLARRHRRGTLLSHPSDVKDFLIFQLAPLEQEVFAGIFLDTAHHIIAFETLFFGTINEASVYPREVVKRALALNAGTVIFAHNHPSTTTEASTADRAITRKLVDAMHLLDIQVLDHVIVGGGNTFSFAEHGLL